MVRLVSPQRLWVTAGVVIAAVAVLAAAFPFAEDKARGHVLSHVVPALVVVLLASVVAWLLRALAGRWGRIARRELVGALWLAAGAQLLEGVGAFAWKGDNETVRIGALQTVHGVATGTSLIALGLVALGVLLVILVVLSLVAGRLRRT